MKQKSTKGALLGIVALAAVVIAAVIVLPHLMGESVAEGMDTEAAVVVSEEQFFGTWQAEGEPGFIINVWRDENGTICLNMDREQGEDSVVFWECTAVSDEQQARLSYSDCTRSTTFYSGDDGRTKEDYEGGSGSLWLKEEHLYWEDDREDAAGGLAFTRIGEY